MGFVTGTSIPRRLALREKRSLAGEAMCRVETAHMIASTCLVLVLFFCPETTRAEDFVSAVASEPGALKVVSEAEQSRSEDTRVYCGAATGNVGSGIPTLAQETRFAGSKRLTEMAPSAQELHLLLNRFRNVADRLLPYVHASSEKKRLQADPHNSVKSFLTLLDYAERTARLASVQWLEFCEVREATDHNDPVVSDIGESDYDQMDLLDSERLTAEQDAQRLRQRLAQTERNTRALLSASIELAKLVVETQRASAGWLYVAAPDGSRIVTKNSWLGAARIPRSVFAIRPIVSSYFSGSDLGRLVRVEPIEFSMNTFCLRDGQYHHRGTNVVFPFGFDCLVGKVANLEELVTGLEKSARAWSLRKANAERLTLLIDYDHNRNKSTEAQLRDAEDSTRAARRRAEGIATLLDFAEWELKVAKDHFLMGACELFVWSTFKERVVKAEVQRAAGLTLSLSGDHIARRFTGEDIAQRFDRGQFILDDQTQVLVGHEQLVAIGRRTLSLFRNPYQFLAESPQIAALASPDEREQFFRDTEARLSERGYKPQTSDSPNLRESGLAPASEAMGPDACLEITEQLGLFGLLGLRR